MRNNVLSASAAAGQLAQSSLTNSRLLAQYSSYTTGTTTSYTPSSLGSYGNVSFGGAIGMPTWQPQSYPTYPPFKGQVINWGGKVYYQPSDKMRALVDALRLL